MTTNSTVLEEIGFSKGEIKVYFALIELGETTIGPLAAKAQVTPAKVYLIIEKLIKKGLCGKIIKSGTKYFSAAQPQRIIEFLDEKKKKIDKEKKQIAELIPILEQKRALSKEQQTATVYQTFDGMRTMYNEIIETLRKNKEDFIAFTLGEEEYKYPESIHFFREYDRRRKEDGIKLRMIGHASQKAFFRKQVADSNMDVRFTSTKLPTGIIMFGNKVATMVWQDVPTAFVVESKIVAKNYKQFFEDIWRQAHK